MVKEELDQLINDIISFNKSNPLTIEDYEQNWGKVDKFYGLIRDVLKEVDRVEFKYLPEKERHYYDPENVFLSINYDHFVHNDIIHIYSEGEFSGDLYYASIKRSWIINPEKIEKEIRNVHSQNEIRKLEEEIERREVDLFMLKRKLYNLIDNYGNFSD